MRPEPKGKNMQRYVFTSEAVSEGHPDKVADQISDAILDAALALDPAAHVAAESFVGPRFAANLGEVSEHVLPRPDPEAIAAASSATSATTAPARASTGRPSSTATSSAPSPPTSPGASTAARPRSRAPATRG